jgi:3-oxoacyl-[acyl-carrier protein] reductase
VDLGLAGRVALVTGASRGIGRAIAAALAAEGARVAVAARSAAGVATVAEAIGGRGYVFDSANLDAVDPLVDAVEAELGPIDVYVANTGGPPRYDDPLAIPVAEWEAAHRTLVISPMLVLARIVPGMRERGFGRVLNVASAGVREPIPNLMLSNAHRISMLNAFKTIARQVAADGVTLNTVLPGRIDTDRLAELLGSREAAVAAAEQEVPAGRLGTVEEFAAIAVLLCSARASYVTGETVAVDGGLLRSVF